MKKRMKTTVVCVAAMTVYMAVSASAANEIIATPTRDMGQSVYVDDTRVYPTGYNIEGNNYFKLRDIGALVGFGVEWDSATQTVEISTARKASSTTGITDEAVEGAVARVTDQRIAVDGIYANMKAYQINGNNYVKLRDIAFQVNFGVDFDNATNRVIISPKLFYGEKAEGIGNDIYEIIANPSKRPAPTPVDGNAHHGDVVFWYYCLPEEYLPYVQNIASSNYAEISMSCDQPFVTFEQEKDVYMTLPLAVSTPEEAEKLESAVETVIVSCVRDGMSDYEVAKALHDWLVLNNRYAEGEYAAGDRPYKQYTAYGALVDRVSVCEGYAEAYKKLMDRAGIPCELISGWAGGPHAWNIVQIDGEWYHVDTTWDDPIPNREGYVRYEYFLKSDAAMSFDHNNWDTPHGACTSTRYDDAVILSPAEEKESEEQSGDIKYNIISDDSDEVITENTIIVTDHGTITITYK